MMKMPDMAELRLMFFPLEFFFEYTMEILALITEAEEESISQTCNVFVKQSLFSNTINIKTD